MTDIIDPKDQKYYVKDPQGFNPERNKAIIAQTIADSEKYHRTLHEPIDQELGERIEAVAHYGVYRFNRGTKSIKEYLGPKAWEKYVGEKLLSKIRVMRAANKLAGNDKFESSILL